MAQIKVSCGQFIGPNEIQAIAITLELKTSKHLEQKNPHRKSYKTCAIVGVEKSSLHYPLELFSKLDSAVIFLCLSDFD